jgi:hypothetical protein
VHSYAVEYIDTRDILSEIQVELAPSAVSWLGGTLRIILRGAAIPSLKLKEQRLIVTFGNTDCLLKVSEINFSSDIFVAHVIIHELTLSDRNGAFLSLSTSYGLEIARRWVQVEPLLSTRCVLTNTASGMNLIFSAAIDKSLIMSEQRSCSLYFKGDSLNSLGKFPSCVWISDSDLLVSFGLGPRVQAGNYLVLNPDQPIRSLSGLSEVMNSTVLVEESVFPQSLVVSILGPGTIGMCSNPIYSVSTYPDLAVLPYAPAYVWSSSDSVLNSCLRGLNQAAVSVNMICLKTLGTFITLSVTLLSPYGLRFSDEIQVFLSPKDVPSVNILSPSKMFFVSDPNIMFSANFSFSYCSNLNSDVKFLWTLFHASNGQRVAQDTASQTGSIFIVAPNSIQTGLYKLQLTAATDTASSTASILFLIQKSVLIAQIQGGNRNVLPDAITLDGSKSFDPDGSSSLQFVWTCLTIQQLNCFSEKGSIIYLHKTPRVSISEKMPLGVYTFVLKVSCTDGRTSFSQVQLNVTDTARPIGIFSVQLQAARTQNPFVLNLGRPFALSAQDMNNSRSVHVDWFANKDVDLNNIEICPIGASGSILLFSGQQIFGIVSFRVQAIIASSSAQIEIFVNLPPQGGLCHVLPETGSEITVFTSTCSGITDENLPISFGLRYYNLFTSKTVYLPATIDSTRDFLLPSGTFLVHLFSCDAYQSCADVFSTSMIVNPSINAGEKQLNFLRDSLARGRLFEMIDTVKLIAQAITPAPRNRRLLQQSSSLAKEILLAILNTTMSTQMNAGISHEIVGALQSIPIDAAASDGINPIFALNAFKKLCRDSTGYATFSVVIPYLQSIFAYSDPSLIPEILSTTFDCRQRAASDILIGKTQSLTVSSTAWTVVTYPAYGIDVYDSVFTLNSKSSNLPKVAVSKGISTNIGPGNMVSRW